MSSLLVRCLCFCLLAELLEAKVTVPRRNTEKPQRQQKEKISPTASWKDVEQDSSLILPDEQFEESGTRTKARVGAPRIKTERPPRPQKEKISRTTDSEDVDQDSALIPSNEQFEDSGARTKTRVGAPRIKTERTPRLQKEKNSRTKDSEDVDQDSSLIPSDEQSEDSGTRTKTRVTGNRKKTEKPQRPRKEKISPNTSLKNVDQDSSILPDNQFEESGTRTKTRIYCPYSHLNSDSFDDQYEGCTEKMETLVLTKLLNEEKHSNKEFGKAWDYAEYKWHSVNRTVPRGFRDEYGIAVLMYTNRKSPVYYSFNAAVKTHGVNYLKFRYNALHFFLTRAVTLLRSSCKPWMVHGQLHNNVAQNVGDDIRFGQFLSSFTEEILDKKHEKIISLSFSSCFGANITDIMNSKDEDQILIPVDEIFQVTKRDENNNYVLNATTRRCHYYNCYYLRGFKSRTCVDSSDPLDDPNSTEQKVEETTGQAKRKWDTFSTCVESSGLPNVPERNITRRKGTKSSARADSSAARIETPSMATSMFLLGILHLICAALLL